MGRHQRPQRPPAARHAGERLRPRGPDAAADGDRPELRLQVRPAAGRRPRGRRPVPAQPALGPRAAAAHRPGRRRSATTCSASTTPAEFLDRYTDVLRLLIPGYRREGKRYLTLAVGCTGGKHRSVAIAEEFARRLARRGRRPPPPATATWAASSGPGRTRPAGRRVRRRARPGRRAGRWRRITPELTAVVTVADDGGSSGRIRREMPVLPPGDLRMALAALAGDDDARAGDGGAAAAPLRRHRRARRAPGGQPGAHRAHRDARRRHRRGPSTTLGRAARRLRPGAADGRRPARPRRAGGEHRPRRPGAHAHHPRPGRHRRDPGPRARDPSLAAGPAGAPGRARGDRRRGRGLARPGLLVHLGTAAPAGAAAARRAGRHAGPGGRGAQPGAAAGGDRRVLAGGASECAAGTPGRSGVAHRDRRR